ncbi:MAG: CBS domain-containing protein [Acidobacteriota bacterium]|jgi:CBS domain-containing protein
MGDHTVGGVDGEQRRQAFVRALLDDVNALERMLETGMIESGVRRIGAEQEIFLVDRTCQAAPVAPELLEKLDALGQTAFTTELAKFNLEANLPPWELGGDVLSRVEAYLNELLELASAQASELGADVFITGILPTLRMADLSLDNMTPVPRYRALNDATVRMRRGDFEIRIKGIDEFYTVHDNVMLESCNTSFQIHFQVGGDEFARLYNLAQAVTAPVLAAAVNSPILAEHRLWQETRVALFQRSIDSRRTTELARGQRPRVHFGERWVERSILEIFREDVARFRVVLATEPVEDPLAMVERGEVPELLALRHHNGTVYRWNRPCYGVSDGVAHLRIENRALPAGPTVVDQMANAAFYFGLMSALSEAVPDVTKVLSFDDAKTNFVAAARHGLHAHLTWFEGRTHAAGNLILDELLPVARRGLALQDIRTEDVDRYLGVLEERVRSGRTGSQWALDSLSAMDGRGTRHQRCRAVTAGALARQKEGRPVHEWSLAQLADADDWRHSYRTVGQFMTSDLFTVRPDDLVDLAANLMDWEHIRHVPVEDHDGNLVGILSHRTLVRLLARGAAGHRDGPIAVRDIMKPDPVTVSPETLTLDAIETMRRHAVSCLPVVEGTKLVGILTERDLIAVTADLLDQQLRELHDES